MSTPYITDSLFLGIEKSHLCVHEIIFGGVSIGDGGGVGDGIGDVMVIEYRVYNSMQNMN